KKGNGLLIGAIAGGTVFVVLCGLVVWLATPHTSPNATQVNAGGNNGSTGSDGSSNSTSAEGIPEQRLKDLKAATVYVKVEGNQSHATGSGSLIHVNGETGLVATNRHVIA